ncbi:MAG: cold shock domain-containing protein [Bacteroidota bacterium]
MGKSQETFNKKEKEKKRLKKRKEKLEKREERKAAKAESDTSLESMMAYVDEDGNIVDTPPDPTKKKKEIDAESIDIGVPRSVQEEEDPVRKGKVEFFNDSKGFGFIRETETRERHFVHANGLLEDIQENDKVQFELERGLKGMNAVRVKKI